MSYTSQNFRFFTYRICLHRTCVLFCSYNQAIGSENVCSCAKLPAKSQPRVSTRNRSHNLTIPFALAKALLVSEAEVPPGNQACLHYLSNTDRSAATPDMPCGTRQASAAPAKVSVAPNTVPVTLDMSSRPGSGRGRRLPWRFVK